MLVKLRYSFDKVLNFLPLKLWSSLILTYTNVIIALLSIPCIQHNYLTCILRVLIEVGAGPTVQKKNKDFTLHGLESREREKSVFKQTLTT